GGLCARRALAASGARRGARADRARQPAAQRDRHARRARCARSGAGERATLARRRAARAARWRAAYRQGQHPGARPPSNLGHRLYADFVPARDELPVARVRAAGAVILGKTNVPEFTLQGYTDNPLFGPTRNPWNLALTPGGSSGGAVACVASGLGPIALGTDGGGSIRRPASHVGVVGLKPSRGRVPRCDGFPTIPLDFEAVGAIARTVGDVVLAMRAITDPDARDPASAAFTDAPFAAAEEPRRRRILYVPTFAGAPVDPEIAASVAASARAFERLGHAV